MPDTKPTTEWDIAQPAARRDREYLSERNFARPLGMKMASAKGVLQTELIA